MLKEKEPAIESLYTFVCGSDDFLVNREAEALFKRHSGSEASASLSQEIIEGNAQNVDDAKKAIGQFIEAMQTRSLLGEKKVVWFKSISFLGDSVVGRAEGTKASVETLLKALKTIDPEQVTVILTASPVDRRTRAFKALKVGGDFRFIASDKKEDSLKAFAIAEFEKLGIGIEAPALEILLAKTNENSRLLLAEVQKLATYLGSEEKVVKEPLVMALVSQFGEGDFFEVTEAFFSLDLSWTLDALVRHFFIQKESRPIIASLQNRNRLLIQLKVLMDAKTIRTSAWGVNKDDLQKAATLYKLPYAEANNKSNFNVFSQNAWYLAKLAELATNIPLKLLFSFQCTFIECFEGILSQPTEQEGVLRKMVLKCL